MSNFLQFPLILISSPFFIIVFIFFLIQAVLIYLLLGFLHSISSFPFLGFCFIINSCYIFLYLSLKIFNFLSFLRYFPSLSFICFSSLQRVSIINSDIFFGFFVIHFCFIRNCFLTAKEVRYYRYYRFLLDIFSFVCSILYRYPLCFYAFLIFSTVNSEVILTASR